MEKVKKNQRKRKHSIYSVAIVSVIVLAIIYGIFALARYLYYLKYEIYEEKMNQYGFSELYNNKTAATRESVTKSEMVKVIVGSFMNINDASGLTLIEGKPLYDNQYFVEYAKDIALIENEYITDKNQTEIAELGKTTEVVSAAVTKILEKEEKELISNSTSNLFKGKLNKLIIDLVEKYSTIYTGSTKDAKLVTDKNKLPSNYEVYPYIIDTIPKEAYEIELRCLAKSRYQTPKDEYKKRKEVYSQIDSYITEYYNTILNIDYTTINEKKFYNSIKDYLYYDYTDDCMHEYVEYVKKHKIKITGEVTPLLPIIYNDGEHNIVRVKVKFRIVSSDTKFNVLLPDIFNKENIKYDKMQYEFYADLPMGTLLTGSSLRVLILSLPDSMIGENISIKRIDSGEE